MKSPQELFGIWVDALINQDYQQTTKYLKTDEGYCCLGVLEDLYSKHIAYAPWERCTSIDTDGYYSITRDHSSKSMLTHRVADFMNFSISPCILGGELWRLNDEKRLTLKEIGFLIKVHGIDRCHLKYSK